MAAALTVVLALLAGPGGHRPEVRLVGDAAIRDAADRALAHADRLADALSPALRAAREGAARVVAGDESPAPRLDRAAMLTAGAAPVASELGRALGDLDRARTAMTPGRLALPAAPGAARLVTIAGQLSDTAVEGARFAEARRGAGEATARLADALRATQDGDATEADELLRMARAALDEVRPWEGSAVTLTVWTDTVDAMIGAMQRLVDALRARDADAARAAAAAFRSAAADAEQADRALRIGLDEAGSGLTAGALGGLADAAAAVEELRAALRALGAGGGV